MQNKSDINKQTQLPYLNHNRNKKKNIYSLQQSKRQFILQKSNSKLPDYQPLKDKHLNPFLMNRRLQNHLIKVGLIRDSSILLNQQQNDDTSEKRLPKLANLSSQQTKRYLQKTQILRSKRGETDVNDRIISKNEFDEYIKAMRQKLKCVNVEGS